MDFEVIWTGPALADLDESLEFVRRQSPARAEALRSAILDQVDFLRRFPRLGAVYGGHRPGTTREITCKPFRVFYRIHEAAPRVEILAVRHGARSEPDLAD